MRCHYDLNSRRGDVKCLSDVGSCSRLGNPQLRLVEGPHFANRLPESNGINVPRLLVERNEINNMHEARIRLLFNFSLRVFGYEAFHGWVLFRRGAEITVAARHP